MEAQRARPGVGTICKGDASRRGLKAARSSRKLLIFKSPPGDASTRVRHRSRRCTKVGRATVLGKEIPRRRAPCSVSRVHFLVERFGLSPSEVARRSSRRDRVRRTEHFALCAEQPGTRSGCSPEITQEQSREWTIIPPASSCLILVVPTFPAQLAPGTCVARIIATDEIRVDTRGRPRGA